MQQALCIAFAAGLILGAMQDASALTIYDVQYSTLPDYVSPYNGQTVDVTGGIVTKVFLGGRTKITIQDPSLGDAWAGVQVVFDDATMAADIVRGDQIDLFTVVVDEYRGNTQLAVGDSAGVIINSSGNLVEPLTVSVAEIPNPANAELSEKYEFMLLRVENVQVGTMDLGKNDDDYELFNADGVCWASDYANIDLPPGSLYYVNPGDCFQSVTGYLEQYLRPEQGWDYYQLLPRDAEDYEYGISPTTHASWGEIKALFK